MNLPDQIILLILEALQHQGSFNTVASFSSCSSTAYELAKVALYNDVQLGTDCQLRSILNDVFAGSWADGLTSPKPSHFQVPCMCRRMSNFKKTKSLTLSFFPSLATLRALRYSLSTHTEPLLFPNATRLTLTEGSTRLLQSPVGWRYIGLPDHPLKAFAHLVNPTHLEITLGQKYRLSQWNYEFAADFVLASLAKSWDRVEEIHWRGEPSNALTSDCPQRSRDHLHIHHLRLNSTSDPQGCHEVEQQSLLEKIQKLLGKYLRSPVDVRCAVEVRVGGVTEEMLKQVQEAAVESTGTTRDGGLAFDQGDLGADVEQAISRIRFVNT